MTWLVSGTKRDGRSVAHSEIIFARPRSSAGQSAGLLIRAAGVFRVRARTGPVTAFHCLQAKRGKAVEGRRRLLRGFVAHFEIKRRGDLA